jgi:hypothetical protein
MVQHLGLWTVFCRIALCMVVAMCSPDYGHQTDLSTHLGKVPLGHFLLQHSAEQSTLHVIGCCAHVETEQLLGIL